VETFESGFWSKKKVKNSAFLAHSRSIQANFRAFQARPGHFRQQQSLVAFTLGAAPAVPAVH
jgi:hypothetical protein